MQQGTTIAISSETLKYNFIKEQGMQETIESQKQMIKELYNQLYLVKYNLTVNQLKKI
jgi:hypothetical protein